MSTPELIVLSGMAAGQSGTGQLVAHIQQDLRRSQFSNRRITLWSAWPDLVALKSHVRKLDFGSLIMGLFSRLKHLLKLMAMTKQILGRYKDVPIVIIHTQSLGVRFAELIVKRRTGNVWIYLTDSSFFCVRSYNQRTGVTGACLKCLSTDGLPGVEFQCTPFPIKNSRTFKFIRSLRRSANEGTVRFFAQNEVQAALARQHFGKNAVVQVVGLWTNDWSELENKHDEIETSSEPTSWDVVFHGNCLEAKGAKWALEVAEKSSSDIRFLFPFSRESVPDNWQAPTKNNIHFVPMTWDSGLFDAVKSSKIVLVPSIWSAPIESALIKSIVFGRAVAVCDEPSAFSSELPIGLVSKLSMEPSTAQKELSQLLQVSTRIREDHVRKWLTSFSSNNRSMFEKILSHTTGRNIHASNN